VLACLLFACAAYTPRGDRTVRVVDLLHELPRADTRPAGVRFEVAEHTFSSVRHATALVPAPGRIIWTLNFPPRAALRTALATMPGAGSSSDASVTFRIGISDDRVYEPLAEQRVSAEETQRHGWIPLSVDLSLYGGRQWSVFYRPDSHPWRLVFNVDISGGRAIGLWGAPGIDTDAGTARIWRR
jgi:hypothetical protein